MTLRTKVLIAACWIGSVLGVGLWAQGGDGRSGAPQIRVVQMVRQTPGSHIGSIITGDQLGFQRIVSPSDPERILGKLMIWLDNEWVEVKLADGQ